TSSTVLAKQLGPLLPPAAASFSPDPTLLSLSAPNRSVKFEFDPDWKADGPTLDAEGKLVGGAPPAEAAPPPATTVAARHPNPAIQSIAESQDGLEVPGAPRLRDVKELVLVDRPPPPAAPPEEPPKQRSALPKIV